MGRENVHRIINHACCGNGCPILLRILCKADYREIRNELATCRANHRGDFNVQYHMGIAGDGEICQMAMKAGASY